MDYCNLDFIKEFKELLCEVAPQTVLFVCSGEYDRYGYRRALDDLGIKTVSFTCFEPCPEVSSVELGIEVMKNNDCDFVVAVGGGSAIDVAKGIKYYSKKDIRILAVPTTAGTGAEVTRFSVLYRNADKESVSSWDIIPEYQIFDYNTLKSLPYEQRVVTALDAFVHAVEAYWSTDADDDSKEYSSKALALFKENYFSYIKGDDSTLKPMMKCSELAGRAINIARTTAAHALSYKLHKLKGLWHGHAVAISLLYIWRYMKSAGDSPLLSLIDEVENVCGFDPDEFEKLMIDSGLAVTLEMNEDEFDETVNGVNVDRLQNHPMKFTKEALTDIYKSFIEIKAE